MTATTENKGQYYDLIKSRIDPIFTRMHLKHANALSNSGLHRRPWLSDASAHLHRSVSSANKSAWKTRNNIDKKLSRITDIYSFAEPILKAGLLNTFGIDVDVKNTYLKLYSVARLPWYAANILSGSKSVTRSLLDTALHNFAHDEVFQPESAFIIPVDLDRQLFDISPLDKLITVGQFQTLCRELDIGAKYKAHLETFLLDPTPVARQYLQLMVTDSQKAVLKAAAHMALMKNDVSRAGHRLVIDLLENKPALLLGEQPMIACDLCMMDLTLTGIVILRPDPSVRPRSQRMIAYIPHDPEHPLKEYPSNADFMKELSRQLLANETLKSTGMSYHQFFSQFIDHEQRGHFFAGLQQRLATVKWYSHEHGDSRPSWRETPLDHPQLQFSAPPIAQPLWTHLYQQQLNKILNDARGIAVSNADADSNARWAWWENFTKMLSDIFNVALLVLTPFVPGVGELMLAYTAWQLTNEVVEGVVDLAQGHYEQVAEHVIGVVTDVIQLAAFGAGVGIGKAFVLKLSPMVEGMKPVLSFDGNTRLWHPDLTPYEQPQLAPPATSKPDTLGLHRHSRKTVLALEDRHYAVNVDSQTGQYRIEHPTRPQAYSPELRHNNQGAWVHEAENPREWEGPKLMRRLGHTVDGYTDARLEDLRAISGTSHDSLRRMHMENTPPPPLLDDTLTRFNSWTETGNLAAQVRAGQPLPPDSYWYERMVPDMPGWPADRALKVCENNDLTGAYRQYGNPLASVHQTLSIGADDLMQNKLPERLVEFLDDADMQSLLGEVYPKDQRAQALRNRLADVVQDRILDIFHYQYRMKNSARTASSRFLQSRFPMLPKRVAEILTEHTTTIEHESLTKQRRVPLRVKDQARESAFEASAARATEGFYEPSLWTADTERLVLNALRVYTDTFTDLRIEVRDGTHDGPLRCRTGADDAMTKRLLIRYGQNRYEVLDGLNKPLQQAPDFYEAVLSVLPADQRAALGFRTGQGSRFKQWVMAKTELPTERRKLLARAPIRPHAPLETELLLRGPRHSRPAVSVKDKVRNLYPHFSDTEVTAFSRSLHTFGDAHWKIGQLENELRHLKEKLQIWRQRYLSDLSDLNSDLPDNRTYFDFQHKGGRFIFDRLLECFERRSEVFQERSTSLESGYMLDLSKEMLPHDLQQWWDQLPAGLKPWLDQITTLNLDGQGFSSAPNGLLKDFLHLRQLSARHCGLKTLPESVGQMQRLQTLRLSDNQLQLTPANTRQLESLRHLEILRLDNNPLNMPLNVAGMPRLRILSLVNTQIDAWPLGLFDVARPRGFFLDLGGNPLRYLPEVEPGSDQALLIARTRVHLERLRTRARSTYERYRKSVGLRPSQTYATVAEDLLEKWPISVDTLLADETPGIGALRPEAWHELASEPGSDGFFKVLQDLTRSADYEQGGEAREQLTDRVWRMIDAMDIDTRLREDLFAMSTDPEGCEDAGAQLFNSMGVRVLESEARTFSRSPEELERALVTLAKGAARLKQVKEIARADIAARRGEPDEVEIHLAYETGLAKRLELPWQSEAMKFRQIARVTDETIEAAYNRILGNEAGDGLVNQMLDQPLWEQYLEETWPGEIEANTRAFQEKADLLIDLQDAQERVVESANLPASERKVRWQTLAELVARLSLPEDRVSATEKMSEYDYYRLLEDLGRQEKDLLRRLTREAMARAQI